jgi:hypothetical protein
VGFLRRLLGGSGSGHDDEGPANAHPDGSGETGEPGSAPAAGEVDADLDAEERARELELLRAEQERLGDLVLRQQRYADRSWVPPSQGGPRRADDGEGASGDAG